MVKIDRHLEYIEVAKNIIEPFDLDTDNYALLKKNDNIIIKGNYTENKIISKKIDKKCKFNIDFFTSKNSTIYIGSNVKGNIHIKVHSDNSLIYIGNNCTFKKIIIDSNQSNDFIAIGNSIFANFNNAWRSGLRAGNDNSALIIGDDCMFGSNIVIRNTDAHPIYDIDTEKQINSPSSLVCIEPHVWVGENVNILKNVTIGACSIIGYGSIVTKDAPRFSISVGVPSKYKVNKKLYWSKTETSSSRDKAKYYREKYI